MKLRNWFRQTMVHNTLTLNNKNLETHSSVTHLWKPEGKVQILVTMLTKKMILHSSYHCHLSHGRLQ